MTDAEASRDGILSKESQDVKMLVLIEDKPCTKRQTDLSERNDGGARNMVRTNRLEKSWYYKRILKKTLKLLF
jgi:hypothetical protein